MTVKLTFVIFAFFTTYGLTQEVEKAETYRAVEYTDGTFEKNPTEKEVKKEYIVDSHIPFEAFQRTIKEGRGVGYYVDEAEGFNWKGVYGTRETFVTRLNGAQIGSEKISKKDFIGFTVATVFIMFMLAIISSAISLIIGIFIKNSNKPEIWEMVILSTIIGIASTLLSGNISFFGVALVIGLLFRKIMLLSCK